VTDLVATLGWYVLAILMVAFARRLGKFILEVYFGKNINLSYKDKNGVTHSKRIHVDNDDELFSILKTIQNSRKESLH